MLQKCDAFRLRGRGGCAPTAGKEQKWSSIEHNWRLRKGKKVSADRETADSRPSKKTKRICLVAALILLYLVAVSASLLWDRITLAHLDRIAKETGLILPRNTVILATNATLRGPNYEWLIECKTDLAAWIATVNGASREKWRSDMFGNVATLSQGAIAQLPLTIVWRFVQVMPDGREETAYLYIAQGNNAALIETFRP